MRTLTLILCLVTFGASAEQVYKQVDKAGIPTFSDQAMPGAERINIEEPVTFKDDVAHQAMDRRKEEKAQLDERARNVSYSIQITDPADDSAVRDNAGNLAISVRLTPNLMAGHKAELRMDGNKIRNLSGTGSVQLSNVDRGTHQFKARVINEDGETLAESNTVSVSLLRYALRKQPR